MRRSIWTPAAILLALLAKSATASALPSPITAEMIADYAASVSASDGQITSMQHEFAAYVGEVVAARTAAIGRYPESVLPDLFLPESKSPVKGGVAFLSLLEESAASLLAQDEALFLAIESVLTADQRANLAHQRLRRIRQLYRSTQMLDFWFDRRLLLNLAEVVEHLRLPDAFPGAVPSSLLLEYERELAQHVGVLWTETVRLQRDWLAGPSSMSDPDRRREAWLSIVDQHSFAFVDLHADNDKWFQRFRDTMPRQASEAFRNECYATAFPIVFPGPREAEHQLAAALTLDDLSAEKRDAIEGLREEYRGRRFRNTDALAIGWADRQDASARRRPSAEMQAILMHLSQLLNDRAKLDRDCIRDLDGVLGDALANAKSQRLPSVPSPYREYEIRVEQASAQTSGIDGNHLRGPLHVAVAPILLLPKPLPWDRLIDTLSAVGGIDADDCDRLEGMASEYAAHYSGLTDSCRSTIAGQTPDASGDIYRMTVLAVEEVHKTLQELRRVDQRFLSDVAASLSLSPDSMRLLEYVRNCDILEQTWEVRVRALHPYLRGDNITSCADRVDLVGIVADAGDTCEQSAAAIEALSRFSRELAASADAYMAASECACTERMLYSSATSRDATDDTTAHFTASERMIIDAQQRRAAWLATQTGACARIEAALGAQAECAVTARTAFEYRAYPSAWRVLDTANAIRDRLSRLGGRQSDEAKATVLQCCTSIRRAATRIVEAIENQPVRSQDGARLVALPETVRILEYQQLSELHELIWRLRRTLDDDQFTSVIPKELRSSSSRRQTAASGS